VLRKARIYDATEAPPLMAYTVFMRIASVREKRNTFQDSQTAAVSVRE
jgi:hypothetical protein